MTFEQFGFHPNIMKALHQLGHDEPTPIQKKAMPIVLSGRDLIAGAPTGTGKTAAFILPILNRLQQVRCGRIRALVLTPTRELAAQINEATRSYAAHLKLYTCAIYGGVHIQSQSRLLNLGTDIVIATPGRLIDHLNRGSGRFDSLEFLVLDEADRMLDMGFLPEVKRIIARLPQERQTMLFSATMAPEIQKLGRQILRDPATVQIGRRAAPAKGISQSAYPVAKHLKTALLVKLMQKIEMESVLIFARTKIRTDRLARSLQQDGFDVARIHGDRTQGQRMAAIEGFRSRRFRILVATDIAARGLDIDQISHVVNYDVPINPQDYVHRIGRTARAAAIGEALTLVAPEEESSLRAIQQLINSDLNRISVADFDLGSYVPRPGSNGNSHRRDRRQSSFAKGSSKRNRSGSKPYRSNNGKRRKKRSTTERTYRSY